MSDKSKRKNSANSFRNKVLLVISLLIVSFISFYVGTTVAINRSQADYEATRTAISEAETATREAELNLTATLNSNMSTPTPTWLPTISQEIIQITATALANAFGTQYALSPTEQPMCFFNWAYNDASEQHYAAAEKLLSDAGFSNFEIKLPAHGEDQVCMQGEDVVSSGFLLMDISPEISLIVDSAILQDQAQLGAQAETIVDLLANTDLLAQIYRLNITFTDGEESLTWSLEFNDAIAAISGKIGARDFWTLGTS